MTNAPSAPQANLAVTGTIGIDTIEAPTGRAEEVLGGSCTYFSAAASFYGPVRMVAAVGDDFPASGHAAIKRFPNIDTAGLEVRAGSKTFRWGGKYRTDMNSRDTLFTELGVLAEKPPTVPQSFRDSRLVFLANSHPAVQAELLSAFTNRRLAVADTMDLWINTARQELLRLLKMVNGLVLNYDEAELFTGKRNPVTAARHILDMGPRFVIVKKGEHGSILVHADGVCSLPAYPTETVVDPTGCGDTFAGGVMGALAAHDTADPGSFEHVRRAIVHGTVIASFTIEAFSLDRLVKLTKPEIDSRYHDYVHMVRV
ncbi:MAG: PfkB family carbohydrate kinase [Planctomycetota bacterium]|nr:PfkB family carbohydrate kinase [Planctomycetota bacterium]